MLDNYPSKNVLCLLLALCFDVSAASVSWTLACTDCKYYWTTYMGEFTMGDGNSECQDICESIPTCLGVSIETLGNVDKCSRLDPELYPNAEDIYKKYNNVDPFYDARSFLIQRQEPPTGDPTGVPGSCFHGDGSLLLKSGNIKKFSELSLGDEIKTSNGLGGFTYSSILTLPHKNNTEPALFVTLTTESGKKLDLTSDHFIPKCDQTQVTAAELVVGDCLLTIDGKETLVEVSSEAKNGVFTAITKDKYIVVDGVVASPFSKNTDPMKPELDYEKYRMELEEKRARRVSAQVSELQKKAVGHTSN